MKLQRSRSHYCKKSTNTELELGVGLDDYNQGFSNLGSLDNSLIELGQPSSFQSPVQYTDIPRQLNYSAFRNLGTAPKFGHFFGFLSGIRSKNEAERQIAFDRETAENSEDNTIEIQERIGAEFDSVFDEITENSVENARFNGLHDSIEIRNSQLSNQLVQLPNPSTPNHNNISINAPSTINTPSAHNWSVLNSSSGSQHAVDLVGRLGNQRNRRPVVVCDVKTSIREHKL